MPPLPRDIAVIGGGIAGLACAWLLSHRHRVHLFEANGYVGGHSNTVSVTTDDGEMAVDTGFVLFNERNYPNLVRLFDWLGVEAIPTDMSFSVSTDDKGHDYTGTSIASLFLQCRLWPRSAHWRLLRDLLHFNARARHCLAQGLDGDLTFGEFLDHSGFAPRFQQRYLLPMTAAIWSCPAQVVRAFPAPRVLAVLLNRGLLDLAGNPRWRTVRGGSQSYVERMLRRLRGCVHTNAAVDRVVRERGSVCLHVGGQHRRFDAVVMACHADQALALMAESSADERDALGAFRYHDNHAALHSDTTLMPRRRRLWSTWNYMGAGEAEPDGGVFISYWMNRLQRLSAARQFFVSLNAPRPPAARHRIAEFTYRHPVFDRAATRAQARVAAIQGRSNTWYCGSYLGHGFHEDALGSALAVSERLGATAPWHATAGLNLLDSRDRSMPG